MNKKKTLLKNLSVSSVDLCNQGANPEAHFVLKKSLDVEGGEKKLEVTPLKEIDSIIKSMYKSMESILADNTLSTDEKTSMFHKSIEECTAILKLSSERWTKDDESDDESIESLDDNEREKETKRKYDQKLKQDAKNLHPEVKKAMDEVSKAREELEEVKKAFEISQIQTVAKKYEIIGKKADELAPKLYELKKSGGTAHDDYIAMLDEMLAMQEGSGILKEFGSNQSGMTAGKTKLDATVSAIMKADRNISYAQAVVKACDEHPELKAEYEY